MRPGAGLEPRSFSHIQLPALQTDLITHTHTLVGDLFLCPVYGKRKLFYFDLNLLSADTNIDSILFFTSNHLEFPPLTFLLIHNHYNNNEVPISKLEIGIDPPAKREKAGRDRHEDVAELGGVARFSGSFELNKTIVGDEQAVDEADDEDVDGELLEFKASRGTSEPNNRKPASSNEDDLPGAVFSENQEGVHFTCLAFDGE